ncbi:hypothetical protein ACHAP5_007408 [Fusarium lateritium]
MTNKFVVVDGGIAIGPLPIRTRFDNTDNQETEQHEAEHPLISYDSDDESTGNHSQYTTDFANILRDVETTTSVIVEELNDASSWRHLPRLVTKADLMVPTRPQVEEDNG